MQQRYRPTIERKRHSIHVRLTGPELDYVRQAAAVHRTTISAYLLGLVDADMAVYWRDQIQRQRQRRREPEPPSVQTGAAYMGAADDDPQMRRMRQLVARMAALLCRTDDCDDVVAR